MRVFTISDVHIDYETNADWLFGLSVDDYTDDALILAGDVSDDPRLLERCFTELTARFRKVLYVPGNHDLWVQRWGNGKTSLDKYRFVREMALALGVSMTPFHHGRLSIVPLLSWYDYSFGAPSPELDKIWMDYRACIWPDNFQAADVTRYFIGQNESAVQTRNEVVISFSHFLPRLDLMPPTIPAAQRVIYPVLGSDALERQIRRLRPQLHVYGHSHVNRRVTIDGITYLNNAFGYPSETGIASKRLTCILEE